MKKVVVTGAKGGTGPSIVKAFCAAGYQVFGVDLKSCDPHEIDYRQLDLEDGAQAHDAFVGADAIVHFGSLPSDSATTWEVAYRNIALGGYHVLQAAANLRVPRIVLASSPMIYGDYSRVPYLPLDEDTPHAPEGIYGAAKQNLEELARHFARWKGISIAALRPQRIVYEGAYDWRARPYNSDDAAAVNALWSYVDARDVAAACLAWVESDHAGFEAFNVAADDVCVATPTRDLVRKFYPHVRDLRQDLPDRTGLVNCGKLKQLVGWRPRHTWQAMRAEHEAARVSAKVP